MTYVKVRWFDDEMASIDCACGVKDMTVSIDGNRNNENTCSECGRRYKLIQAVTAEEPSGRCANPRCDQWFYSAQSKRKYCSEACGIWVRKYGQEAVTA